MKKVFFVVLAVLPLCLVSCSQQKAPSGMLGGVAGGDDKMSVERRLQGMLPSGASQMGSSYSGGRPLTVVSGDPHPVEIDFKERDAY
jgi:hypothetical protein